MVGAWQSKGGAAVGWLACAAAFSLLFAGARAACPPEGFDSITPFNLTAWTDHPWYIQQQMPLVYQPATSLYCVRASYQPNEDGTITVSNTARAGSVDGPVGGEGMGLKAVVPDESDPSKLAVGPSFLPPTAYGPYWVVFAGPSEDSYDYGIVSGGPPTAEGKDGEGCVAGSEFELNDAGLWLFTKETVANETVVDMLRDKAKELGFDLSVLKPVTQEGCEWDDE